MNTEFNIVEKTSQSKAAWETDVFEESSDKQSNREVEEVAPLEISTELHHSPLGYLKESDFSVFVRVG